MPRRKWAPVTADASRWLGVKVAELRPATPGLQIKSAKKPQRSATFYGKHPQPEDWFGNSWWLLEEEDS